jgi:predicted TIM-barrel fold metal-dependent hydrolase
MIVDAHVHILSSGEPQAYRQWIQDDHEVGYLQQEGLMPTGREISDEDWEPFAWKWDCLHPERVISWADQAGVDKSVLLPFPPCRATRYGFLGTVDLCGHTSVAGPPSPEKANDYVAALVQMYPDKFIGFATANPLYHGPEGAAQEVERGIEQLGLCGVKLIPTYNKWSPDNEELAFPMFETIERLGVPVIIHQAFTGQRESVMEYGRPARLDVVGRTFRKLTVLLAHAGKPWYEECLAVVSKHPTFYLELSSIASKLPGEQLAWLLARAVQYGIPWERIIWGTDAWNQPIEGAVARFTNVAGEMALYDGPEIPDRAVELMMGDNISRLLNLE